MTDEESPTRKAHNRILDLSTAMWEEFGATNPVLVEGGYPQIRRIARLVAALFLELVRTEMEPEDALGLAEAYLVGLVFNPDHPHLQGEGE